MPEGCPGEFRCRASDVTWRMGVAAPGAGRALLRVAPRQPVVSSDGVLRASHLLRQARPLRELSEEVVEPAWDSSQVGRRGGPGGRPQRRGGGGRVPRHGVGALTAGVPRAHVRSRGWSTTKRPARIDGRGPPRRWPLSPRPPPCSPSLKLAPFGAPLRASDPQAVLERPAPGRGAAGDGTAAERAKREARGAAGYGAGGREGRRKAAGNAPPCPARGRRAAKREPAAGHTHSAARHWLSAAPLRGLKPARGWRPCRGRGLQPGRGAGALVGRAWTRGLLTLMSMIMVSSGVWNPLKLNMNGSRPISRCSAQCQPVQPPSAQRHLVCRRAGRQRVRVTATIWHLAHHLPPDEPLVATRRPRPGLRASAPRIDRAHQAGGRTALASSLSPGHAPAAPEGRPSGRLVWARTPIFPRCSGTGRPRTPSRGPGPGREEGGARGAAPAHPGGALGVCP